ncbi:hypothetical protein ACFL59_01340 [Planctomycetota bacterium]
MNEPGDVTFGTEYTRETGERSEKSNWVKDVLETAYVVGAFEGYTVKDNRVTLLLDRCCFRGDDKVWSSGEIHELVQELEGRDRWRLKLRFASLLGVPWKFVAYQETPRRVALYALTADETRLENEFGRYREFAAWTEEFRDLKMKSAYQETGLPGFDKALRQLGVPWPGNLDAVVGRVVDCEPLAVVEYQNTNPKYGVERHCNNDWFLGKGNRKGDEQRWKVLDVVRLHAQRPLWIFVWSQKRSQGTKAKIVREIVYSNDVEERPPGLRYSVKKTMPDGELVEWVAAQLGT